MSATVILQSNTLPGRAAGQTRARPKPPVTADTGCRLCGAPLHRSLLDLGSLPLANRTVIPGTQDEPSYPLHARICDECNLVQVSDVAPSDVVAGPVPYLSSRSAGCVQQAARYAEAMRKRLHLNADLLVIEVGSNDGYLLRHFQSAGVPVLGIDPARNAATAAAELGIPTETSCFSTGIAMEIAVRHGRADLLIANNVLPHVPDLFDFAAACTCMLRPNGILSLQVPHLLSIIQRVQFDAFRHDAYTYLSLRVLERVLRSVGLRVFDAERLPDHGGSLRISACHAVSSMATRIGLKSVRLAEASAEGEGSDLYSGFSGRAAAAQHEIREFLEVRRAAGRRVWAYGAATRGTTMLNACGITTDLIGCVADPDLAKHGRSLPGSHIPIVTLDMLLRQPPNDLLILPWTNVTEAMAQAQPLRHHGTQFWVPLPLITRV